MHRKLSGVCLSLLACAGAAILAPRGAAGFDEVAAPVEFRFDKRAVAEGFWHGTVEGDIAGDLTTVLTERRVSGPIWHVRVDWIILAGESSFVADLRGTLDTAHGDVVMDGTIVEGYMLGARVHEEGHLTDADTGRFEGSIQLMPAVPATPRGR